MAKLVLMHKADSIYEDQPDTQYDFPKPYLKAVQEGVGDWVICYEPVKAGPHGYFAVAKIQAVIPKPGPGRPLSGAYRTGQLSGLRRFGAVEMNSGRQL